MNCTVEPTAEHHFESLHRALDTVAREKKYLALTQAPPLANSIDFYCGVISSGFPHFVALDGDRVVGWCDVSPVYGHSREHVGVLGIALVPEARGRGLGTRLLEAAIGRSWERGLTRIELSVRTDNAPARALYERLGFEHEGVLRRSMLVDGGYIDCHAMALLR